GVVRAAGFAAAELKADGATIQRAIDAHGASDIQRITFLYDGSGLEVETLPAADVARMADARARAGKPPLALADQLLGELALRAPVTRMSAVGRFTQHSRTSDSKPWNGGDYWDNWHDTNHNGVADT